MGVDNRQRSEEHVAGFITVRRFRWGTVPGSGHRVSCALSAVPFGPGWAS